MSTHPTGGLIIAAPSSGSGKTVVSLGLMRHFSQTGVNVGSLKSGPDYIDAAFHGRATGGACFNIDPWAMREETLSDAIYRASDGNDLVVCEGVMGLFDGATLDSGSTADVARLTGWPVVLVVDARAQGASAAAIVKGFATFADDVTLSGVIFNRVASPRHEAMLRQAVAASVPDVPVLGCIPRDVALELPSRHLGLVQAAEHEAIEAFLNHAGRVVGTNVDMQALKDLASQANQCASATKPALPPLGQRIAIASDEAFAFRYPLVLEGWRKVGAEISFFSPLEDQPPAANADAVFLPGGYPELHGYRLGSAETFLAGLRAAAKRGAVVYGECGGYMVLGRGMEDADGTHHAMAGLLPLGTSFAKRKIHLGYRRLKAIADTPLGNVGRRMRAHEFHYATITSEEGAPSLFQASNADGKDLGPTGLVNGKVFGSFCHLIDREALK